jgi:hypothetical protein
VSASRAEGLLGEGGNCPSVFWVVFLRGLAGLLRIRIKGLVLAVLPV